MGAPRRRWDRLLATVVVVVVAAFMFLGFITFMSRMVSNPELAQSGLIRLMAVLAFALVAALGVGRRYLRNQHEDTD